MGEGKKEERRKSLLRIRRKRQEDATYARPRSIPAYPTCLSQLLSVVQSQWSVPGVKAEQAH